MAKATTTKKTTARDVVKGREVATRTKNTVSNVNVDLLEEQDAGKGVSTDIADNVVPLLKVLQSNTPQCLKQKQEHIKGAEAGMIWPRGEKQLWNGEEGIRIVPVHYERIWLEWGAKRGDGLKGRHRKGTDDTPRELGAELKTDSEGKEKWTLPNGHTLQDCREHVVLVLDKYDDEPTPFVLPMSGSNIGTSRNWHPVMNKKRTKKGAKAASYRYVYHLTTVPKSNDEGDWFQMAIDDLDERTTDEVYLLARQVHADFSGGVLVSDVEEPGSDGSSDDGGM